MKNNSDLLSYGLIGIVTEALDLDLENAGNPDEVIITVTMFNRMDG